jgi:hypothetical protein
MPDVQVTQGALLVYLIVGAIGVVAVVGIAVALVGARVPKGRKPPVTTD